MCPDTLSLYFILNNKGIMENRFIKVAGLSLIIGSFLLIITMVLHPSGGSIEHILKIRKVIIASHSLAIFSLPFVAFGFYGLSNLLLTKSKISILAFIIFSFGLVAGMVAATINGLTIPIFLSNYSNEIDQNLNIIKPLLKFGFAINKPLDYILITASSISIGIWSVLIIRTSKMPKWVGYYGLSFLLLGIIATILQFNFITLLGFRVFIFGMVSWIIITGVLMIKKFSNIVN